MIFALRGTRLVPFQMPCTSRGKGQEGLKCSVHLLQILKEELLQIHAAGSVFAMYM